jgi:uncharacterized protein YndB with AHSA1/START domain
MKKYFLTSLNSVRPVFEIIDETAFITQWKTDNAGTTNNDQINFRVEQASNYHIDWGDGNDETFIGTGDLIHTYSSPGTYTVTVTGQVVFSMKNNGDRQKLVDILQHGDVTYLNDIRTLYNTSLTSVSATDIPDLSNITSMRAFFLDSSLLTDITNFHLWDVSTVTDITNIFYNCTLFNDDIPIFTSATNGTQAFQQASSFNQNINGKFPALTNGSSMLQNCASFNNDGVGISGFNTVLNANSMFNNCDALNVTINGFTNCTTATDFLANTAIFNSTVSGFNSLINSNRFFLNAISYNQPIGFSVSQISFAQSKFQGATSYNQVTNGYTNLQNANSMFNFASSFNNGGVSMTGYDSLTNTSFMFRACVAFDQDTSALNVSAVTNSSFMYNSCSILNSPVPTSSFNSVTTANNMFNGCNAFNQPIGPNSFNSCTNAAGMFRAMPLFNQPLVNCFASIVTGASMFNGAVNFDQDLSSWNFTNTTSLVNFMAGGAGLSTTNYDLLLPAMDAQTLQSGVSANFGTSTYTLSSPAETARTNIVTNDLWTIVDGGGV